jgi:hypothetical protein
VRYLHSLRRQRLGSAADKVNDQDNYRDDEQQVNEAARHVSDEAQQPENEQNYKI